MYLYTTSVYNQITIIHYILVFSLQPSDCSNADCIGQLGLPTTNCFRICESVDFRIRGEASTPTPWLTQLLVLGKSQVNQKSF